MPVKLVTLIALLLSTPAPAYAYLDPSSGSMVFQMVVGGLLAGAAAIRLYWKKIKGLFGGRKSPDSE